MRKLACTILAVAIFGFCSAEEANAQFGGFGGNNPNLANQAAIFQQQQSDFNQAANTSETSSTSGGSTTSPGVTTSGGGTTNSGNGDGSTTTSWLGYLADLILDPLFGN